MSTKRKEMEMQFEQRLQLAKFVFSDKKARAQVLQQTMREFTNRSIEEIASLIGDVSLDEEVTRDRFEISINYTKTDKSIEGGTTFHLLFPAKENINDKENSYLIDIEFFLQKQNEQFPRSMVMFYLSQMAYKQGRKLFKKDYGDCLECISIWICIDEIHDDITFCVVREQSGYQESIDLDSIC